MIFCLLLLVNDSTGFAFKPASVRFSSPTYQPLIPVVVADGQVSWKEASELAESTKLLTAKRGGAASLAVLSAPWLIENDNLVLWLAVTGAAFFLLSREERLDPGSAQSCAAWFGGERGSLLYDKDGVSVTEVDALDELGGQWRCLRTAKGQVVQSALRVVQGSLHPGALSGYTRALGAAALACSSLANHQTCRVLNLGLGGGTVVNFLCAHAGATVVAVDYSKAVVAATRATMPPLEGLVDIVVEDAARYVNRAKLDQEEFDVVVIDVFDDASRTPESMSTQEFANNVAELVYARRGGISMNLVSETALGETQVALSCAENARRMIMAFEDRGAHSFLTPDDETNNAVLWCFFDDKSPFIPPYLRRLPLYATSRASRRAERCGVQFDVSSELARTVFVTSDTVVDILENL